MLNENQISDNWNKLIIFIENNFNGDRKDKLLKMYNDNADRIATSPASNKVYFHSCFVGGYVYHVLNVIEASNRMSKLWKNMYPDECSYTDEELNFVALNHDLGKIGDEKYDYYVDKESDWHRKRGELFEFHRDLQYMKIQHRSLYWLQLYGITVTKNEYVGIMIHDGLYDDGNKTYYIGYDPRFYLKSMLPYVIHFADLFAFKKEYYEWASTSQGKGFLQTGELSSLTTNFGNVSEQSKRKNKKIEDIISKESDGLDFNIESFNELFNIDNTKKEKDK